MWINCTKYIHTFIFPTYLCFNTSRVNYTSKPKIPQTYTENMSNICGQCHLHTSLVYFPNTYGALKMSTEHRFSVTILFSPRHFLWASLTYRCVIHHRACHSDEYISDLNLTKTGSLLLSNYVLTRMKLWISNYIHGLTWDAIYLPCHTSTVFQLNHRWSYGIDEWLPHDFMWI